MAKVSVLDLTVAQITEIETATGTPFGDWDDAPHQADLYARVYAAHTGVEVESVLSMTLRQLAEVVSLEGEDEDPPSPSEPSK